MNDCGYYKTAPSVFHARLERFVDDIANLVAQRADLQATIASGGDITEEVYTAGLLGRIPDCIHDDAGRNVEVVGGDVTTADELLLKGSSGFTVVVRGLPYKHCRELVADGENDPRFLVRGEAPGEAPRNYGDCLNLPALFRFGMKLPMPNTAYVYKQIKRGDLSERPKNPQACGLFQQIMTGQHGGSSCSYYKEILIMMNECDHDNNAHFDTPATAYCKAALQCQSAAIAELQRVGSSGLKKSDLDKRIRLYEEVVWGETDKAVDAVYELYLHYPGGLIDPR
ncbi:MAG TPA: hypothetical protein ENI97_04945, partial [Gammaproteobacteria bacterium]|nr:hypothetical protein [Gammaproteobacteria bacterium]